MTLPQNQTRRKILVDADGLEYVKREIKEKLDKFEIQLGTSGYSLKSQHDEGLHQKINLLTRILKMLETELEIDEAVK